jgi:ElaB/YqjD/DUF883 family membrane-anchored ribosome-binding protein
MSSGSHVSTLASSLSADLVMRTNSSSLKGKTKMTSAHQAYRQATKSPAGRQAAETAEAAAETAKSVGEDVSDFASDVSRRAGEQLGRAQNMAVDAFDEAHAAVRRNPLTALAIALGLGFLFGIVAAGRR